MTKTTSRVTESMRLEAVAPSVAGNAEDTIAVVIISGLPFLYCSDTLSSDYSKRVGKCHYKLQN